MLSSMRCDDDDDVFFFFRVGSPTKKTDGGRIFVECVCDVVLNTKQIGKERPFKHLLKVEDFCVFR